MSLEDALNANTAAVLEHNELLKKMLAGAKPAAAAADKPAATKPAAAPKATKPKEVTVEALADRTRTFLKTGAEDEREERKKQMATLLAHYGVDRITTIDPSKFAEAVGFIDAFSRGENPLGDSDDYGDGDSMV